MNNSDQKRLIRAHSDKHIAPTYSVYMVNYALTPIVYWGLNGTVAVL